MQIKESDFFAWLVMRIPYRHVLTERHFNPNVFVQLHNLFKYVTLSTSSQSRYGKQGSGHIFIKSKLKKVNP